MRAIVLAGLLTVTASASATRTFLLTPDSRGSVSDVLEAAANYSRDNYGDEAIVTMDPRTPFPVAKEPVEWRPKAGEGLLTINVTFRIPWYGINYQGPAGTAFITSYGLCRSRIVGLAVSLTNPLTIGFWAHGDPKIGSSSYSVLASPSVTFKATAAKCVGIRIGGPSGNDYSGWRIESPTFAGTPKGTTPLEQLKNSANAWNVGLLFSGANNLCNSVYDIGAAHIRHAVMENGHPYWPGPAGGSRTSYYGGNMTGVVLPFLIDGGFDCSIYGMRMELCAAAIVMGAPLHAGEGNGLLIFEGIDISAPFASRNFALGIGQAGELIGIRKAGESRISAHIWYGKDGRSGSPVIQASNDRSSKPSITLVEESSKSRKL